MYHDHACQTSKGAVIFWAHFWDPVQWFLGPVLTPNDKATLTPSMCLSSKDSIEGSMSLSQAFYLSSFLV